METRAEAGPSGRRAARRASSRAAGESPSDASTLAAPRSSVTRSPRPARTPSLASADALTCASPCPSARCLTAPRPARLRRPAPPRAPPLDPFCRRGRSGEGPRGAGGAGQHGHARPMPSAASASRSQITMLATSFVSGAPAGATLPRITQRGAAPATVGSPRSATLMLVAFRNEKTCRGAGTQLHACSLCTLLRAPSTLQPSSPRLHRPLSSTLP